MNFFCKVCESDFESSIEDAIRNQESETIGIKIEFTFVCPNCSKISLDNSDIHE